MIEREKGGRKERSDKLWRIYRNEDGKMEKGGSKTKVPRG